MLVDDRFYVGHTAIAYFSVVLIVSICVTCDVVGNVCLKLFQMQVDCSNCLY